MERRWRWQRLRIDHQLLKAKQNPKTLNKKKINSLKLIRGGLFLMDVVDLEDIEVE